MVKVKYVQSFQELFKFMLIELHVHRCLDLGFFSFSISKERIVYYWTTIFHAVTSSYALFATT